ncbi:hypothetical protein BC832DRAFT_304744 [Gaertneriomyces semiglobifer]|nr:hypothetical protein BC832DRAFT_304744 [Gaertneriomyces semiglobifer]
MFRTRLSCPRKVSSSRSISLATLTSSECSFHSQAARPSPSTFALRTHNSALHPTPLVSRTPLVTPLLLSQRRNVNFFAEFAKSVKKQVQENKDFQDNVKQLSAATNELAESDAVQRAKKAAEKSGKVIEKVGEAVDKTLQNPVVQKTGEVLSKTGEKIAEVGEKVAEPILDTKAAKAVGRGLKHVKKEVIDSASNAYYHEYQPREVREKERAELLASRKTPLGIPGVPNPHRVVTADPEAGANVELHRSSKLAESWRKFKEDNAMMQKLFAVRRGFQESDNPVLESVREFFSSAAFEETEQAQVVRAFRAVDPMFSLDKFLKDATKWYLPEILEAYLKADAKTLQDWCSERAYARLSAGFESQRQQGLVSDCKLLDVRRVDIRKVTLLEDEVPVILVSFQTNEILMFKNAKGELVLGKPNNIETATYVMAFTKAQAVDPSAEHNPHTEGWVVIDWSRSTGW